jgi:tetratricopeptide (TPR) repeat protein
MVLPILALCVATSTAAEQARDLYRAGSEAYRQGQYEVAIRAFEEVLRVEPRAQAVFSAAQAHRLQFFVDDGLPHLERSVAQYRRYLELTPAGGRRDHAAQHLATLAPLLERRLAEAGGPGAVREATARLIVAVPVEGALARVDDGEPAPIPATFEVTPGQHKVRVEAPEHQPAEVDTLAVAGTVVALNLTLTPAPGRLTVVAPAEASVRVDGRRLLHPGAVEVPPGPHVVTVTARGRVPFQRQVEVTRGGALAVQADLPVTSQRVAAWSLVGVGGALAAGAGVSLGRVLSRESEAGSLEAQQATGPLSPAEVERYRALEDSRDDLARLSAGLAGAAGAALVTAALLWIFDDPDLPGPAILAPGVEGPAAREGVW